MRKIVRGAMPNYFIISAIDNWKTWGKAYPIRYKNKWIALRNSLLPDLQMLSNNNCSFCGAGDPLKVTGELIEHFKPRALYPNLSFYWHNLFLCCNNCQKNTQFQKGYKKNKHLLLKPDSVNYDFRNYFRFNTQNGELEAKKDADALTIQKVKYTIEYYNLNNFDRPQSRKDYFDEYIYQPEKIANKKNVKFRFLFE
jgi:uncharacterized protein (TIGR02646 family)